MQGEGKVSFLWTRIQFTCCRVVRPAGNTWNFYIGANHATNRLVVMEHSLLLIFFAFVIGAILAGLAVGLALRGHINRQNALLAEQQNALVERARWQAVAEEKTRQIESWQERAEASETIRQGLQKEVNGLGAQVSELTTRLSAEQSRLSEQLALVQSAREQMSLQFRDLAQAIFEEKSQRFTEHNQSQMQHLINPLRERIDAFRTQVESIQKQEIADQARLRTEIEQLRALNIQISEEAHALATALKGKKKMQGDWGELVLENILESSGLREGIDYLKQSSINTEDGRRRPDVIINLPQGKHLVIDAKVSLNAYVECVNAEDELTRTQALAAHVAAINDRINELSDRHYDQLPGIHSPEVVFLFMPIESAFVEAIRADPHLFEKAIQQNLLLATPTTLLTSLKIVRQLWRFEEQNRHTKELAERAGKMYKKLRLFVETLEELGKQIGKAHQSYEKAMGQLVSGKDNLIKQASDFERLGVAVDHHFSEALQERAQLELESAPNATSATLPEKMTITKGAQDQVANH